MLHLPPSDPFYFYVVPNNSARIFCSTCNNIVIPGVESFQWYANESVLAPSDNVMIERNTRGNNDTFGSTLIVSYLPFEYNLTSVQCRANADNGRQLSSNATTIIIRGMFDITTGKIAQVDT